MNAQLIKSWCDDCLSPLAWSRILTRILPHFNQLGYYFQDLKDPSNQLALSNNTVSVIKQTVQDIYHQELPLSL